MKGLFEEVRMLVATYFLSWAASISPNTKEGGIINKHIRNCMYDLLKENNEINEK